MEGRYRKAHHHHAIMISFPLQGHITPFVHLALNLASKGFTITFVHTQSTHHLITQSQPQSGSEPDLFAGARDSGLDIRYKTISDGLPVDFDRSLGLAPLWKAIFDILPSHIDQLVGDIVGSPAGIPPRPTCLVSDTFYVWPAAVAAKYNLVNVSFWTEAATVFSLYYHLDLLIQNDHINGNGKETIDYIPGVDTIQRKDLTSQIQANNISKVVEKAFKQVKKTDFILCNTVQELESGTISALQQKQPIYAIGPIFPFGFTKTTVATNMWFESDCAQWLDPKPHGSVLYVSFGSYAHASKNDIAEIAWGLLLSGVNFVWAIRPDIVSFDDTDFLPIGFKEGVKDRGLIVPWCSQTIVISHPAIGGFFMHCGWNSILEGVWCGIPFICFPLESDQLTNRKLVVDDWKIGINLCDNKSIARDEVSTKINHLMSGKISEALRKKIAKMRKTLQKALAVDGSSNKSFDQFIEDMNVKLNTTEI